MKTQQKIILLLLTTLLISCSTQRQFTTIDILQPSIATFDKSINKLLLVNNSSTQPYDKGHYTFITTGKVTNETIPFDSAAIFCLASVKEHLAEKEFFEHIKLLDKSIQHSRDFYHPQTLTRQQIHSLCQKYQVDGILSLDQILLRDEKADSDGYVAVDMYLYTNWSIHTLEKTKKNVQRLEFADSLSWESIHKQNLPNITDFMVDMCITSGKNIADKLIPFWEQQDRYFFVPHNKTMRQAMDSVSHQNWNGAINTWKKIIRSTNNKKLIYQATNNIAISYEIIGEIEKAIQYTEQSLEIYSKAQPNKQENINEIKNYLKFLKQRKINIKLLDKQLSN